jgi:hypothetical protein
MQPYSSATSAAACISLSKIARYSEPCGCIASVLFQRVGHDSTTHARSRFAEASSRTIELASAIEAGL